MLTAGLVSITFRKLTSPEIIHLVRKSGLKAIEWGGDIHVPHGNIAAAAEVQKRTDDAGLSVAAYGSYYRVGQSEQEQDPFEEILETAVALKAPIIRVWAGTTASEKTPETARAKIVRESRRIAKLAAQANIAISFEYHAHTLTDTNESAAKLLDEIAHPNASTFWQPRVEGTIEEKISGLESILPKLTNVHAYHWKKKGTEILRKSLSAGESEWRRYLEIIRRTGRDHNVLLEFVRDDDPEAFLSDARVLQEWIGEANK